MGPSARTSASAPPPPPSAAPIAVSREGGQLRLAVDGRRARELAPRVKELPHAAFDPESRTWTVAVCAQTVDALRGWFHEGLVDVAVDGLLEPGEQPDRVAEAVLEQPRSTSPWRGWAVRPAVAAERLMDRLRALPGARWDKRARVVTYPRAAAAPLASLVDRGVVGDPEGLLRPYEVTVLLDATAGGFRVRVAGDADASASAQRVFDARFPDRDVVDAWRRKGLDAGLLDALSAQVYAGELARRGDGVQPQGLQLDLYGYQRQDVAAALRRDGYAFFHAPGLGKSPLAIAVGVERLARGEVERCVVLCPGDVRSQWGAEIARFSGHTDVVVINGRDKRRRARQYAQAASARWVVVHYDVTLKSRDFDEIAELAAGSLLVVDEAHHARDPDAKRAQATWELARLAAARLALTGTPVENQPGEWYSILGRIVEPGYFGRYQEFASRYRYPNPWGGFEGARNLDELARRSHVLYARRTKGEVADHLPPLVVQAHRLDPSPGYAGALRRAHREARKRIAADRVRRAVGDDAQLGVLSEEEREEIEQGAEMTATSMLKLLCVSPRLIGSSDAPAAQAIAELAPDDDGPKVAWLRATAEALVATRRRREQRGDAATPERVAEERMVVFSSSRRFIEMLVDRLVDDGVPTVSYTGESSLQERDEAQRRFLDPEDEVVVFAATDAAAEGLNLGRSCGLLVNADFGWTPGRLIQRANRIHRVDGTAHRYRVVNLLLSGTVEEGIAQLVEAKGAISDALFGERDASRVSGRRNTRSARQLLADALERWAADYDGADTADAAGGETADGRAGEDVAAAGADGGAEPAPASQGHEGDSGDGGAQGGGPGDEEASGGGRVDVVPLQLPLDDDAEEPPEDGTSARSSDADDPGSTASGEEAGDEKDGEETGDADDGEETGDADDDEVRR